MRMSRRTDRLQREPSVLSATLLILIIIISKHCLTSFQAQLYHHFPSSTMSTDAKTQHDELMDAMAKKKAEWDAEDAANPDGPDDTDKLLSEAIAMAIDQGKGWKEGEREAYLEKILDDDYIPPLFASTEDELERTGLTEAFASLQYAFSMNGASGNTALSLSLKFTAS